MSLVLPFGGGLEIVPMRPKTSAAAITPLKRPSYSMRNSSYMVKNRTCTNKMGGNILNMYRHQNGASRIQIRYLIQNLKQYPKINILKTQNSRLKSCLGPGISIKIQAWKVLESVSD